VGSALLQPCLEEVGHASQSLHYPGEQAHGPLVKLPQNLGGDLCLLHSRETKIVLGAILVPGESGTFT